MSEKLNHLIGNATLPRWPLAYYFCQIPYGMHLAGSVVVQ